MLGASQESPYLLVDVNVPFNKRNFEFGVVNGNWRGALIDSWLYIRRDISLEITGIKLEILCENQNRLRCHYRDYQIVFNNYPNTAYVAPPYQKVWFGDMDSNIPF